MVFCGCWFYQPTDFNPRGRKYYLPQVDLQAHTHIQSTASRTKLRQTFVNNTWRQTPEIQYTFPLYDGVSVVSFKCTIGDKVIFGVVKEKNQARTEYNAAVSRGEAAGLLEQSEDASDVFTTKIGNLPKDAKAIVEIEYVGELKNDAQLDGTKFTIPTTIAPRYGNQSSDSIASTSGHELMLDSKIGIVVDVEIDEGAHIEALSSLNHPAAITLSRTSTQKNEFKTNRASAALTIRGIELRQDFEIVINSQDHAVPRALIEQHPNIPNHRALMTTLVPKFNLRNIHPEIVFVVDRSGSMGGKIHMVVQALRVFLKSLPLSAKFNICSFGSSHSLLFPKSQPYDEKTLNQALQHVEGFSANYGGTELLEPIKAIVQNRLPGIPLEVMVLTDGEIWNQQQAFDFVNEAAKNEMRLFSLGIGFGASTALVEGLARAGKGFAQFVKDNELMDKRVVRMLKAALTPHISNYRLELIYDETKAADVDGDDLGFELVESTTVPVRTRLSGETLRQPEEAKPISLFDPNFTETAPNPPANRYDHLPKLDPPEQIQAPTLITGLFPFSRMTAYLLLPNSTRKIKSAMLKGSLGNTPVELEIAVQDVGVGKTVHQLAAKRAMLETEEGRGWLSVQKNADGVLLRDKYQADWERIVEREAVRLGVTFQVAGKYCSFVAVEKQANAEDKVLDTPEQQQQHPATAQANTFSSFAGLRSSNAQHHISPPYKSAGLASLSGSATGFGGQDSFRVMARQAAQSRTSAPGGSALFGAPQPPASSSSSAWGFGAASNSLSSTGSANSGGLFGSNTGVWNSSARSAAPASFSFRKKSKSSDQQSQQKALQQQAQAQQQQPVFRPPIILSGSSQPAFGSRNNVSSKATFGQAAAAAVAMDTSNKAVESEEDSDQEMGFGLFDGEESYVPRSPPLTKNIEYSASDTTEAKVHKLIGLQKFDGSWSATVGLFKLTDVSKGDFEDASFANDNEAVKATILAIAWLEKHAASEMEIWEMVVDKAKEWLESTHGINNTNDVVHRVIAIFFP